MDTKKIVDSLSVVLSDTYVLYTTTQFFHWNVVGEDFYPLHKLFNDQYDYLAEVVDTIAERIRAFDGIAPGTFKVFNALTNLNPPDEPPGDKEMVAWLLAANETVAETCQECLLLTSKENDFVTNNMIGAHKEQLQKNAWMLRSILK